jgi:hypothetical protein
VGHAGADYGSLGMMSGYNIKYGFGISFTTNSESSLNCTDGYASAADKNDFFVDALCPAYDQVLAIVVSGSLARFARRPFQCVRFQPHCCRVCRLLGGWQRMHTWSKYGRWSPRFPPTTAAEGPKLSRARVILHPTLTALPRNADNLLDSMCVVNNTLNISGSLKSVAAKYVLSLAPGCRSWSRSN